MEGYNPEDDNKYSLISYLIIVGLFLILVAGAISFNEFHEAKKFCNSIEGEYDLNFFPIPPTHFCNNATLIQYNNGWNFERFDVRTYNFTINEKTLLE